MAIARVFFVAPLGASLAFVWGCQDGTGLDFPLGEPWVTTDRSEYELVVTPGTFTVRLTAQFTNQSDATLYLHRSCGAGDEPQRLLVRTVADETPIELGSGVCITTPLRRPIPIGPGETFFDDIIFLSHESPHANPPITMAMRTGQFRLVYHIQRTNRAEGWDPVDLIPLEARISNAFAVLPPDDFER